MNQEVTVYSPIGEEDKYGNAEPIEMISKARVQFSSKTIQTTDGTTYQTILEVDLPTETIVTYGTELSYTFQGVTTKGKVLALEDVLNLSGSRVDYRTVNVG